MLKELRVRNFRLLRDVALPFPLGWPLVVIGPNSSGKSSLIEVLDFVKTATSSPEGLDLAAYRRRRGPLDFIFAGARVPLEIELRFARSEGSPLQLDGEEVHYRVTFEAMGSRLSVTRETVDNFKRGLNQPPLRILDRKGTVCRLYNRETRRPGDVQELDDSQTAIGTIELSTRYPTVSNLRSAVQRIFAFSGFPVDALWVRDEREQAASPRDSAVLRPLDHLDRRGLELTNYLYTLKNSQPQRWRRLEQIFIREFPSVAELLFPPDPGGSRITLAWRDRRFPEAIFFLHQMSSGMLQFLCLLAAAATSTGKELLAFDEPDSSLHPSAVQSLIEVLEERAREVPVLIATHSDPLLDHLENPVESVVASRLGGHGAVFEPFNKEALRQWRSAYSMSELRRRDLLDDRNSDEVETG